MKSRTMLVLLAAMIVTGLCGCSKTETAKSQKAGAEAPFQDVLASAAVKDRHAAESLLIAVARAGNRVVGVGQHGHIVYSDDQGKHWTQATVPVSSDLLAVHFPSAQNGWAVGHDGVVLHTSDGGATWTKQFDGRQAAQAMESTYSGTAAAAAAAADTVGLADEIKKFVDQGPDKPFLDVWFENDTTGYIVGAFNLIFQTVDAGKTWTPWYDRMDNPKHYHLYAIRPIGTDVFITAEQGTVFKLDRAKGRFQEIKTPYTGTFFGITGKPSAIVAHGMRGNAFRSRDGGRNWEKVETGAQTGLMGSTVTEDGKIVLVTQSGNVLVSNDDGGSFSMVKMERPVPAAGVTALNNQTIALVGVKGVQVQSIQ